ncbi:MAG: hypothetical protein M0Z46_13615 [Actinomycetota bacterium]|nr:hypothetical protein [Actinomycetota bacterium]
MAGLDKVRVNRALGIATAKSLFDAGRHLLGTASAISFRLVLNGENQTG